MTQTVKDSRLATGGWLYLTRQAFHLLDYSPLSGRTIPIYRLLVYIFYYILFPKALTSQPLIFISAIIRSSYKAKNAPDYKIRSISTH